MALEGRTHREGKEETEFTGRRTSPPRGPVSDVFALTSLNPSAFSFRLVLHKLQGSWNSSMDLALEPDTYNA